MTVGKWFELYGDEEIAEVISDPEGVRGVACLERITECTYGFSQTDDSFAFAWDSIVVSGDDDVEDLVRKWVNLVSYSPDDVQALLTAWHRKYNGLYDNAGGDRT